MSKSPTITSPTPGSKSIRDQSITSNSVASSSSTSDSAVIVTSSSEMIYDGVVLIFVILAIVAFTVVIIRTLSLAREQDTPSKLARTTRPDSNKSTVVGVPVNEFTQCLDRQCEDGTVCDPIRGICVLGLGSKCSIAEDCVQGLYCSGVCVQEPPGIVTGASGSPCPCHPGSSCVVNQDSSARVCS
jgi:hypothetical protein